MMNEAIDTGSIGRDDRLMIHYSIHCQGSVLEASEPGEPVEYQMGTGSWPMQLELSMLGETIGEKLTIRLEAAENAFGSADAERIVQMERADFAEEPALGSLVEFSLENGETVEGQVLSVLGEAVQVDFNHPYAGRDLVFKIHIISKL